MTDEIKMGNPESQTADSANPINSDDIVTPSLDDSDTIITTVKEYYNL